MLREDCQALRRPRGPPRPARPLCSLSRPDKAPKKAIPRRTPPKAPTHLLPNHLGPSSAASESPPSSSSNAFWLPSWGRPAGAAHSPPASPGDLLLPVTSASAPPGPPARILAVLGTAPPLKFPGYPPVCSRTYSTTIACSEALGGALPHLPTPDPGWARLILLQTCWLHP